MMRTGAYPPVTRPRSLGRRMWPDQPRNRRRRPHAVVDSRTSLASRQARTPRLPAQDSSGEYLADSRLPGPWVCPLAANRTPVRLRCGGNRVDNAPRHGGKGHAGPWTGSRRTWTNDDRAWKRRNTTSSGRNAQATTTSCVLGLDARPLDAYRRRVATSPENTRIRDSRRPIDAAESRPGDPRRTTDDEGAADYRGMR